jgi:hypothetical protein
MPSNQECWQRGHPRCLGRIVSGRDSLPGGCVSCWKGPDFLGYREWKLLPTAATAQSHLQSHPGLHPDRPFLLSQGKWHLLQPRVWHLPEPRTHMPLPFRAVLSAAPLSVWALLAPSLPVKAEPKSPFSPEPLTCCKCSLFSLPTAKGL